MTCWHTETNTKKKNGFHSFFFRIKCGNITADTRKEFERQVVSYYVSLYIIIVYSEWEKKIFRKSIILNKIATEKDLQDERVVSL